MTVNWTIDLGQIIQLLVVIGAVIGAHFSMRANLDKFGLRLDLIEQKLHDSVSDAREDMTAVSGRLQQHEERLFELSGKLQRIIGGLDRRVN